MSSVNLTSDDFVDVDEILDRYRKSKSKILFLVSAIVLIFWGTIGGYTSLQFNEAKLQATTQFTIESAKITATSPYCEKNPGDSTCVKAKELVKNPEKGISPTSAPEQQVQIAVINVTEDLMRLASTVPTQVPVDFQLK